MQEGAQRLQKVLGSLESEGLLTNEQVNLVNTRFESLEGSDSRKSIFAEIAAYLGGAFISIATIFLVANIWDEAPRALRVGALTTLAIALFVTATLLGNVTAMRLRLTSVLSLGSAIAASAATGFAFDFDGAPWLPLSVGTVISLYVFIKYKHEILHVGTYVYLFITGLMILGSITSIEPEDSVVYPLYWIILASIWLYLSWSRMINQTLGYLISAATYFLASQFLFTMDHRRVSYLVSLVIAPLLAWIFLQDRRWPLLLGAVLITTVTTGEFVAATLGGSLGALLGLLAAGIALITTSMVAIRNSRHSQ
jgi:hypothetical protein